jgi:hypothetical protein
MIDYAEIRKTTTSEQRKKIMIEQSIMETRNSRINYFNDTLQRLECGNTEFSTAEKIVHPINGNTIFSAYNKISCNDILACRMLGIEIFYIKIMNYVIKADYGNGLFSIKEKNNAWEVYYCR